MVNLVDAFLNSVVVKVSGIFLGAIIAMLIYLIQDKIESLVHLVDSINTQVYTLSKQQIILEQKSSYELDKLDKKIGFEIDKMEIKIRAIR